MKDAHTDSRKEKLDTDVKIRDLRPRDDEAERFVSDVFKKESVAQADDTISSSDPGLDASREKGRDAEKDSRCGRIIPFYRLSYCIFQDDVFTERDDLGMVSSSHAIISKPGPL